MKNNPQPGDTPPIPPAHNDPHHPHHIEDALPDPEPASPSLDRPDPGIYEGP